MLPEKVIYLYYVTVRNYHGQQDEDADAVRLSVVCTCALQL